MMACCCANPACMVNGCQIAAQYRYAPYATPPKDNYTYVPQPLTADDVRRLIREELDAAKAKALKETA